MKGVVIHCFKDNDSVDNYQEPIVLFFGHRPLRRTLQLQ